MNFRENPVSIELTLVIVINIISNRITPVEGKDSV